MIQVPSSSQQAVCSPSSQFILMNARILERSFCLPVSIILFLQACRVGSVFHESYRSRAPSSRQSSIVNISRAPSCQVHCTLLGRPKSSQEAPIDPSHQGKGHSSQHEPCRHSFEQPSSCSKLKVLAYSTPSCSC